MKMIFCFLPSCDKGSSFEQHEHQNITVWKKNCQIAGYC